MKVSILALVTLSMEASNLFVVASGTDSNSVRRTLTVVEDEQEPSNYVIIPDSTHNPIDEEDAMRSHNHNRALDDFHRYMRTSSGVAHEPLTCPNAVLWHPEGYESVDCVYMSYCTCNEGDNTVKENVGDPQGKACYRCSKPDGKTCTKDLECVTTTSVCVNGKCGLATCPTTGTETATMISRDCTYTSCGCSGEYSLKEDVFGNNGCYRCSKPNGASCTKSVECATTSTCQSGKCTAKSAVSQNNGQCPSTTQMTPQGIAGHLCTTTNPNCQCTGEFNVKEDLTGQKCYHCSKNDGATCSSDYDCKLNKSKCYDGKCGPIRNFCPLLKDGRCSVDSTCTCGNPAYPNLAMFTLRGGQKCYTCKA